MTTHDDNLPELLSTLMDEDLSAAESRDLEQRLLEDPAARRAYLDHFVLASYLEIEHRAADALEQLGGEELSAVSDQRSASGTHHSSLSTHQSKRRFRASHHKLSISIAVAVAVMASTVLTLHLMEVGPFVAGGGGKSLAEETAASESDFVAKLSNWHNDEWADDTRPPRKDPRLKIGKRLVLESGLIEVTYLTGAVVVLEGPAEYEVLGEKSGHLQLGKLTAHVEGKEAEGFTVDTPAGSIEDLGTKFAVDVKADGVCAAQVVEGRVRATMVKQDGQTQVITFTKDESFVLDPSSGIRREQLAHAGRFVWNLPKAADDTPEVVILRVDFQASDDSRLQAGFQPFARSDSAAGKTYETSGGRMTVDVTGFQTDLQGGFHDREVLANSRRMTAAKLYDDFAFSNTGGTLTLTIAGVEANRDYRIRLFSSDMFDGEFPEIHVNDFVPTGDTSGTTARVRFDRTVAPERTLQHSGEITVRSTTDTLTIEIKPEEGSLTRLNGFELFEVQQPGVSTGNEE